MKVLKKILIILGVIILLLFLISLLLKPNYTVERSVVINAEPMEIFPYCNNLHNWQKWMPWTKELDKTAVYTFEGSQSGVGAIMKWNGKEIGKGKLIIKKEISGELVGYDMEFDEGSYKSVGKLLLERVPGGTKVTWGDYGNVGFNPVGRYFCLLMDSFMGPDFEKGLNKLKKVIEKK